MTPSTVGLIGFLSFPTFNKFMIAFQNNLR